MKAGQQIVFAPSYVETEVKSIQMHHKKIPEAIPGDIIGFSVITSTTSNIKRENVCGEQARDPPVECINFTTQMIISNHPGKIHAGYQPVFFFHTAHVACRFSKLVQRIDCRHGKTVTDYPEWIQKDDATVVIAEPSKPLVYLF